MGRGRTHSRERELCSRGVGAGKEHGVFLKPLRGARVCRVAGLSLEVGAGEVGGNQRRRASDAFGRSSCFLQLVLGDSSDGYSWAMKGSDLYFHNLPGGGRHWGQQINECCGEGYN